MIKKLQEVEVLTGLLSGIASGAASSSQEPPPAEPVEVTDEWPIDAYYKYDDELG